jgi:hypothetical protein
MFTYTFDNIFVWQPDNKKLYVLRDKCLLKNQPLRYKALRKYTALG